MFIARLILALIAASFGLLLVAPVIVLGIPFVAVALLTKLICRVLEPRFMEWSDLIEFEANFGWKPKANLNTYHLAEDLYHATTDENGWRGTTRLAESQVVVFGDSFAWGYGVDDKDFFCGLTPQLRMKSIGTVGYNMVQELLCMRRLDRQLKDKLVVWFIYFGNDLYENLVPDMLGYRTPFVRSLNGTGAWEIVTDHISPSRWPYTAGLGADRRDYYGKLADLCSQSSLSEKAYAACEFLLREGKDLCEHVGAELAVMTIPDVTQMTHQGRSFLLRRGGIPSSFDPYYPDEQIRKICSRLDIRQVALKDYLDPSDYKSRDCHWNPKGHKRVAAVLCDLYREYSNGGPARASTFSGLTNT